VHGGQTAVYEAMLKLFPEWIDNVSAPAQIAFEHVSCSEHAASAESCSVLSVHDDLDEYLLEMDKGSVSGSGFSLLDGSNLHGNLTAKCNMPSTHRHVSKDSASSVSATDTMESAAAIPSEEFMSVLDKLSISATRLRILKRTHQGAGFCEAGNISCSDLDAGEFTRSMLDFSL
jgi:hypothetical protein